MTESIAPRGDSVTDPAQKLPDEGWVEITSHARLWEAVPVHERVSRDEIVRRWIGMSEHYRDVVLGPLRPSAMRDRPTDQQIRHGQVDAACVVRLAEVNK